MEKTTKKHRKSCKTNHPKYAMNVLLSKISEINAATNDDFITQTFGILHKTFQEKGVYKAFTYKINTLLMLDVLTMRLKELIKERKEYKKEIKALFEETKEKISIANLKKSIIDEKTYLKYRNYLKNIAVVKSEMNLIESIRQHLTNIQHTDKKSNWYNELKDKYCKKEDSNIISSKLFKLIKNEK